MGLTKGIDMMNLDEIDRIANKIKELEALDNPTPYQAAKLLKLIEIRKSIQSHLDNRIKEMLEIIGDC